MAINTCLTLSLFPHPLMQSPTQWSLLTSRIECTGVNTIYTGVNTINTGVKTIYTGVNTKYSS